MDPIQRRKNRRDNIIGKMLKDWSNRITDLLGNRAKLAFKPGKTIRNGVKYRDHTVIERLNDFSSDVGRHRLHIIHRPLERFTLLLRRTMEHRIHRRRKISKRNFARTDHIGHRVFRHTHLLGELIL